MFNLFDYSNYPVLIEEASAYFKAKCPTRSQRWYSDKMGYTSHNTFRKILKGTQKLTDDNAYHLGALFKMNMHELDFFLLLIHVNQTKCPPDRVIALYNMICFCHSRYHLFNKEQIITFFQAYYLPFLSIISDEDFNKEYKHIVRSFNPASQAEQIEKAEHLFNHFFPSQTLTDTFPDFTGILKRVSKKSVTGNCSKRILDFQKESLSKNTSKRKGRIQNAFIVSEDTRERILALIQKDSAHEKRKYNINIEMYPG